MMITSPVRTAHLHWTRKLDSEIDDVVIALVSERLRDPDTEPHAFEDHGLLGNEPLLIRCQHCKQRSQRAGRETA